MSRDIELWMALHDDCPWPGCGGCALLDYTMDDDVVRDVQIMAVLTGRPRDVLLLEAIYAGMDCGMLA